MALNPFFDRHPSEGITAGRIVISYGEIELRVAMCLGNAIGDQDTALRTMFRLIGESARINVADALMQQRYRAFQLEKEYADTIGAVRYCVRLRNQFAHCNWGDDGREPESVYFTTLNEPAKASEQFIHWWHHLDNALLTAQWDYMQYTSDCLDFLNFELLFKLEKRRSNPFPMPPKLQQPNLHNPPLQHIPPWLDQGEQQRHIEHFQEPERLDPAQPEPIRPSSREKREAGMWRAQLNEGRRRLLSLLRQRPDQ